VDDAPHWLALARGLSEVAPGWVACKSVGGAPTEASDLSSAAPVEEWDVLSQEFRRWAAANRLGPVVVCTHEPHVLHLIALDGPLRFFVLSLRARRVVRGATLYVPETLRPVTELDAWGFRRTRPGAEGVILGCTEFGMLIGAGDASVPLFDTTVLHARRAVDLALTE